MKIIIITAFVIFSLGSPAFALKVNNDAPPFSLKDIRGNNFSLGDYVGKGRKQASSGVVLSFFASWCIQCRKELPIINSLVDELKNKGIQVVIIGIKENFNVIAQLLAELKVEKPVVLSDPYGKVGGMYDVRFLPVTFLVGADGKVKEIIYGEVADAGELREKAGKLLK